MDNLAKKLPVMLFAMFVFFFIFIVCCIMWHGFGCVGNHGGFKLDGVILSAMMLFDVLILGLSAYLLKSSK